VSPPPPSPPSTSTASNVTADRLKQEPQQQQQQQQQELLNQSLEDNKGKQGLGKRKGKGKTTPKKLSKKYKFNLVD